MSQIALPANQNPGFIKRFTRNIVIIIAILSLLFLAIKCFRWSYADILSYQIEYHLNVADSAPEKRTVKHWRQADHYLQQILNLRPQHPQYLEAAERFYQVLDTLETEAPAIINELDWKNNEQQALKYARAGLQLIPSWPYLWKQLVLSKITLKQFDQELNAAFSKATKLGPWERVSQYEIATLGLENWQSLNIETQKHILMAIDHILISKSSQLYNVKVITSHVNMVNACALSKVLPQQDMPNISRHCHDLFDRISSK